MKYLVISLLLLGFFSDSYATNFKKTSPNPWPDDYSQVATMDSLKKWGPYNVHDPSVRKIGDKYYMYSTDAIFHPSRQEARRRDVPTGFLQMRVSDNLVDWDFAGWAFDSIPPEAVDWVRSNNNS